MAPADLLAGATERTPLVEHLGKSGAALERVRLRDGRSVVVKRISPATDLTLALFEQPAAPEYLLWSSGGLDRLPDRVGHVVLDGWTEGEDETVLVMRDLGDAVLSWADRLDAATTAWAVERIAALHRAYLGDPPEAVSSLPAVLGLFAPHRLATASEVGGELFAVALRGWEYFSDPALVPAEVSEAIFALHLDMQPLATGLAAGPVTLAHGDLATVNMAFEGDRLLLLDWAMPVAAPGALDVARLLVGCAHVVDVAPDDVIALYRKAAGPAYDERSMQLALLSALCWLGWNKALDIVESDDAAVRERERVSLAWWIDKAREALENGAI